MFLAGFKVSGRSTKFIYAVETYSFGVQVPWMMSSPSMWPGCTQENRPSKGSPAEPSLLLSSSAEGEGAQRLLSQNM